MRSIIVLLLTLTVVASISVPTAALEIAVRKVDGALMDRYMSSPPAEARKLLAGYTVLAKATSMGRVRGIVPFAGVAVFYFDPNGTVLAWSEKSDQVEAGEWKLNGTHNDVCMAFPIGNGRGVCTNLILDDRWIEESAKGNPFRLKAGTAVPLAMGRFGVSLSKLASKIP